MKTLIIQQVTNGFLVTEEVAVAGFTGTYKDDSRTLYVFNKIEDLQS